MEKSVTYIRTARLEEQKKKLKEARKAAGLTQQELAEKSGVSYSLVCKLESGERNINGAGMDIIASLCEALGCQIQDIMTSPEVIKWAEVTPPALKKLQIELAKIEHAAEREMTRKLIEERMQRMQDERNGIKQEPKPVVKRTTEKIKKTIIMEVEFPADFIPPDQESRKECRPCPFFYDADEYGWGCGHPEEEAYSPYCPIKKYFD